MEYLYFQIEEEVNLEDYDLEINVLLIKYSETNQVFLNLNMTLIWIFIFINPQRSIKICPSCFKRKDSSHEAAILGSMIW